ncbi:hypothetical protein [Stenotrophomonas phage CM2]
MGINIRAKGANGEREVATMMNEIVERVCKEEGLSLPPKPVIQRNQNQSAVGGSDLTNPFGYAIEVKRQETLAVNTWWKQREVASAEFGGTPVVISPSERQAQVERCHVRILAGMEEYGLASRRV